MKSLILSIPLLLLWPAGSYAVGVPAGTVNVQQVYDDARAVKRVAEVSGRDLPRAVLEKIVTEDIDLLRGKRSDGTLAYAHYETEESGRTSDDFTIGSGKLTRASMKEDFTYKLVVSSPTRRFVVRKNKRIYIDHLEIETTPLEGSTKVDNVAVGLWMEPGTQKTFDLGGVMKHASVTLYARVEEKEGTATLSMAMSKARIRENSDSPYLTAVENAKLLLESLRKGDPSNARTGANMVMGALQPKLVPENSANMEVRATPCPPAASSGDQGTPVAELVVDLQSIEDLLTATEGEKRDGLNHLHQLIRRLRSQQ